jgi:hypothetical protein
MPQPCVPACCLAKYLWGPFLTWEDDGCLASILRAKNQPHATEVCDINLHMHLLLDRCAGCSLPMNRDTWLQLVLTVTKTRQ